jgi:Mn2+/Fe2+ NRAMP family transporter
LRSQAESRSYDCGAIEGSCLPFGQRAGIRLRNAALFKQLGPGLVTGAADDDPNGIATYSQAGAQFGFNMLWTMVLTYPLMAAVQHRRLNFAPLFIVLPGMS